MVEQVLIAWLGQSSIKGIVATTRVKNNTPRANIRNINHAHKFKVWNN
jgi:hypothetical protein